MSPSIRVVPTALAVMLPRPLEKPSSDSVPEFGSVRLPRSQSPLAESVVPAAMSITAEPGVVPTPPTDRLPRSRLAVVTRVPPSNSSGLAASPSAPPDAIWSVPSISRMAPVKELVPPSTSVPGPIFRSAVTPPPSEEETEAVAVSATLIDV